MQPESNPFDFRSANHPSLIMQALGTFYQSRNLADVTLSAGTRTFSAHRVILAAGSPYFNAMFSNAHIESTLNHIVLNAIDGESLGLLIDFIYSSTLSITENNVQNLLAAASLLQISAVVEACCQFLLVRLEPDNCLGIADFADLHGCTSLHTVSWEHALQHFSDVSCTEEFLTLPDTVLERLFKSENLQVQSEEQVLDALLSWYGHDVSGRHESFVKLLKYIKLPLITYSILKDKILSLPLVINDVRCHKLLASAKLYQSTDNSPQSLTYPNSDFNPYAARKFQKQLIFIVGGETDPGRSLVATVEEFDPVKETWTTLKPMSTKRRGMGVCILDGILYAIGGSDGYQALKQVECYNPEINLWSHVADLNESRSSVAAITIDTSLYAIGGYDGIMNCLATVERYSVSTNTWTYVKPMNVARSMASVGVVSKCIYMVGGYDGGSDLSSCEVYDTKTDTWSMVTPMNSCRCMAGVGVVNNLLYAVGGCDCSQSLKSVEVYNAETNTWTILAEMSEARSGLGVAVVGQFLYAMGGYTGNIYCKTIEKYDITLGQWIKQGDVPSGRRRFGCCS